MAQTPTTGTHMATETVQLYQQCTAPDGTVGSFLLDTTRERLISPVFPDTADLFAWCKVNGWIGDGTLSGRYHKVPAGAEQAMRMLYTLAEQADARYSATIAARCPGKTRWTLTAEQAAIPEIREAYQAKRIADEAWLAWMRTHR